MTSGIRAMSRWIWLPLVLAAGLYCAVPRALKHTFAPPQRDSKHTPRDLGLPEEQVWLQSANETRLHGWFPRPLLIAVFWAMQRIIGHRFDDFAPRNRIALLEAPVMLVHGDADSVGPMDSMRELAAAPRAEVLVVPDGGHSDLTPFEPYVSQIIEFLNRHLRSKATTHDTA